MLTTTFSILISLAWLPQWDRQSLTYIVRHPAIKTMLYHSHPPYLWWVQLSSNRKPKHRVPLVLKSSVLMIHRLCHPPWNQSLWQHRTQHSAFGRAFPLALKGYDVVCTGAKGTHVCDFTEYHTKKVHVHKPTVLIWTYFQHRCLLTNSCFTGPFHLVEHSLFFWRILKLQRNVLHTLKVCSILSPPDCSSWISNLGCKYLACKEI